MNHPFLDIEAARVKWSKGGSSVTVIAPGSSRLSALQGARDSLDINLSDVAEHKLQEQELSVCADIVNTIQRIAPSVCPGDYNSSTRRSSRSTPSGHRGASPAVHSALMAGGARTTATSIGGSSTGRDNRKALPRGLKDQIVGGDVASSRANDNTENIENDSVGPITRHKLRKVSHGKANKWMRPQVSPEKNDMRSVLDKKFGQLRY